jgi:hypothetical protein
MIQNSIYNFLKDNSSYKISCEKKILALNSDTNIKTIAKFYQ